MRHRLRSIAVFGLLVGAILAAGCDDLENETTLTLYLDPDGGVTWEVLERNIRSTAEDPAERQEQEREIVRGFLCGENGALVGLGSLRPIRIESAMPRRERPYTIVTTARYASIDRLLEDLFNEVGVESSARLERDGEVTRLHVELRDIDADDEAAGPGGSALMDILMRGEELRVVLTTGELLEAAGFEIGKPADTAVLRFDDIEEPEDGSSRILLSLSWVTRYDHAGREAP